MSIQLPSVQSLYIEMLFNGNKLASGTGFVAMTNKGPVLITNRHNVTGLNNVTGECLSNTGGIPNQLSILHNKDKLGEWVQKVEPLLNDTSPLWIEHPKHGNKVDFIALPLTQLDEVKLYPYKLDDSNPKIRISPADNISVVGFPFGLSGGAGLAIWATGFVATEHDVNYQGLPLLLIDCRARQGQSGSAVIAHRNGGTISMEDGSSMMTIATLTRFIGIYSGRINKESDLGFVWKSSAIKELLDSIK